MKGVAAKSGGANPPVKKPKASAKNKPAAKKKAAPVKKPAAKKAAVGTKHASPKKAAPAKKPAAKKAAVAAKHASPKKVAPAKKTVAKKAAPKPVAKSVAKPAAKAAPKPVAKVVAKAVEKPAKVEKVAKPEKPAKVEKVVEPKAAKPEKVEKVAKAAKVKGDAKSKEAAKAAAPTDAFPALDANVKRPAKPFFLDVKPGVERVIKRGDKSAVSQVIDLQARRKGPAAEETSDELAGRIERELQSQSFLKRAPMRPQMCTKCGINAVTPRFTIDRELGYCESCAEILHLGETKEARRMEFNLAVKKEEIAPPSPDEIAAEEAEGDEEPVPDLDV